MRLPPLIEIYKKITYIQIFSFIDVAVTWDTWCGMNIFSAPALTVLNRPCLEDSELNGHLINQSLNQWINYKGVYRTAPATPDLLLIVKACFFGHQEVVKLKILANTYLRIFILTTSRSPKFILKAVLKLEGPYFYCKKKIGAFWQSNKKVENWISQCIFKSCTEGFRVFFSSCQSPNCFTKRLVFTY